MVVEVVVMLMLMVMVANGNACQALVELRCKPHMTDMAFDFVHSRARPVFLDHRALTIGPWKVDLLTMQEGAHCVRHASELR
jgi:hypothetical protein